MANTDFQPWFFSGVEHQSTIVITCEHASNHFPEELFWRLGEKSVGKVRQQILAHQDTHWAFDLHAWSLSKKLALSLGAFALGGPVSRLICDLNRDLNDEDWCISEIEDETLWLNQGLDDNERESRIEDYYNPFHRLVTQVLTQHQAKLLVSLHTFTPNYRGRKRDVEVGILHDGCIDVAEHLLHRMQSVGFDTRMNEPYSGYEGLIASARRHGRNFDIPYVEVEIRNDLIASEASCNQMAHHLAHALKAWNEAEFHG